MRSVLVFGLIGGFTTLVHILTGLLFHYGFGITPFNANILAYGCSFLVSYFGHRQFTFRSSARISHSMPRFIVIALFGLFLTQIVVWVVVDIWLKPYTVALALMIVTVPVATYILGRVWAFKDGDF